MTEVQSIYPVLPSDLEHQTSPVTNNLTVDERENMTHKDTNSNIIDSDISVINEDNQESAPSSDIEVNNQELVPQKPHSTVLKNFFENWKSTDETKKKQKLRNEINDTFILNTGTEVTEDNIDSILNRGDFLVARRIWDKAEGKCHDHFVFVKERLVDV